MLTHGQDENRTFSCLGDNGSDTSLRTRAFRAKASLSFLRKGPAQRPTRPFGRTPVTVQETLSRKQLLLGVGTHPLGQPADAPSVSLFLAEFHRISASEFHSEPICPLRRRVRALPPPRTLLPALAGALQGSCKNWDTTVQTSPQRKLFSFSFLFTFYSFMGFSHDPWYCLTPENWWLFLPNGSRHYR